MMHENEPSIEYWKNLFDAAGKFREIGCWNWMWDSDLFGVQNPADNEIGYCCVMGRNRQVFALAMYLGADGLETYNKTQSGELNKHSIDLVHSQKCLMLSFEDRKELQEKDFEIIKKLDLSFSGKNSWPLFRSYLPGFFPWHLTKPEADFLLAAIQQAIDVSLRFKNNPNLFDPPDGKDDCYFVRTSKNVNQTITWKDQWLLPPESKKTEMPKPTNASSIVEEIKRHPSKQEAWEIDFFYSFEAVREGKERPYYPATILFADHASGRVLHFQLLKQSENLSQIVPKEFRNACKLLKFFPKKMLVCKEEMLHIMEPITASLGTTLVLADELQKIERARRAMFNSFGKH